MPDTEFKDWFCLHNRDTFTIDPKIHEKDARFYFGRKELLARMRRQVVRAFLDPQVPKMMIYGPYGSGKTQTLYHIAHDIVANTPKSAKGKPHVVHLDIEVNSKSGADLWHVQLTEALGMQQCQDWLRKLYDGSSNFEAEIAKLTTDPNIAHALKQLRGDDDIAFSSWAWISGKKLSAGDMQKIKVTRNLSDVGVGDLVTMLQVLGNLARAVGHTLIFFIDEMEELRNVKTGDAAQSWHQYARKLAEPANSSAGFVIGFFAVTLDDAPEMLIRTDIRSRLGTHNIIELDPLPSTENVKQFTEEMLEHLVDQTRAETLIQKEALQSTKAHFPFTASAFELLSDYACQDPTKSTPRNIIKTINECAIQAWDEKKRVIDDEVVNGIAPIVFG